MLVHNCVGHPTAAALTFIGFPKLARKVHYGTLPASSRARWTFDEIEYTTDRRLFLIDFVCAPITAVLQAVGLHGVAWHWRRLFDTPLVKATGACGGWYPPAAWKRKHAGEITAQLGDRCTYKARDGYRIQGVLTFVSYTEEGNCLVEWGGQRQILDCASVEPPQDSDLKD